MTTMMPSSGSQSDEDIKAVKMLLKKTGKFDYEIKTLFETTSLTDHFTLVLQIHIYCTDL